MKKKAPPKTILDISSLHVRRSKNFSLNLNNLTIKSGQVVCLVGANGSGKTTLIETAVGLITPEFGQVQVNGQLLKSNNLKAKCAIGFIPDDDGWIIPELTAREYFDLLTVIYKEAGVTTDIGQTIKIIAAQLLFTQYDSLLGSLSHGNRRKVQIISGLMHQPELVIVDELRNGLDPISIKRAEDLFRQLSQDGTAILAATHDLFWAERFAQNVVMIKDGQILLSQTTKSIVKHSGSLENKFMELYDAV